MRKGWRFRSYDAGHHSTPETISDSKTEEWHPATVPCTVASALRDASQATLQELIDAESFDDVDYWFHCEFEGASHIDTRVDLVFEGLATIAEIWLNGDPLGQSDNMFVRTAYNVTGKLRKQNDLWICFRALNPILKQKKSRARWRTQLVSERNLRFIRTTLFGRMRSWCPPLTAVGPWGSIDLVSEGLTQFGCDHANLRTGLDPNRAEGWIDVEIELTTRRTDLDGLKISLEVSGTLSPLKVEMPHAYQLRVSGRVRVQDVELWWPHTHGSPRLYTPVLQIRDFGQTTSFELDPIGFRQIDLVGPPGPDFAIELNGQPIFCRGTCWTPVDPFALSCSREQMRAALEQVRDAGMNMLRVAGTTLYECDDFYAICDEMGILVWQDFMFATLDYPSHDPDFMHSVESEVNQFLNRVASRACLAMLCGNSEGQQQPAMLGLDSSTWKSSLFDELLPHLCSQIRPDLPYWPSTPSGGKLPFQPNEGTSHYFGVGAYRRPLSDATLAQPRFITECLALSNVPGSTGADTTPAARIPRDTGADWNFKDVTGHYLVEYFGEDVAAHARNDPQQEAALSRATSMRLMRDTATAWRDPRSGCHGALVWLHRDPWPSAGWGVIGSTGRPKSAYYGLKNAWSPVALAILDDGLNGLRLLVFNDRALHLTASLQIQLMRFDGTLIQHLQTSIRVAARSTFSSTIDALFGEFIDSSYAYRFGPRAFDLCCASLVIDPPSSESEGHARNFQTVYFPRDRGLLPEQILGLRVEWSDVDDQGGTLCISSRHFAQTVAIEISNGIPSDNFFDLAPNHERRIRVLKINTDEELAGHLSALNSNETFLLPLISDAPS